MEACGLCTDDEARDYLRQHKLMNAQLDTMRNCIGGIFRYYCAAGDEGSGARMSLDEWRLFKRLWTPCLPAPQRRPA